MSGALEGIRVLDWSAMLNGPVAGAMLGDLGAEVIKIEDPVRGDQARGMHSQFDTAITLPGGSTSQFETSNRSHKGMTLDLKQEQGKQILYRMVEKSDIFITNFRKSVTEKLGVDYETLRKYNPRLIYAVGSAFGTRGAWAERRGYDPVAQALSGAMYSFGDRDLEEPESAVGAIFDMMSASLLAYGILAALVARDRTGEGQEVEASLLGSAMHIQALGLNTQLWLGKGAKKNSRKHSANPVANHYKCSDGKWIMLMEPQSDRYWHDICKALGTENLEKDPKFENAKVRAKNRDELIIFLDKVFAAKTRDEWVKRLEPYDFVYAPILDRAEAVSYPQMLENDYIVDYDHPALGKTKIVGFPVRLSKTPAKISYVAPEFGQHTEDILVNTFGYSWEEIGEFRENGVI